MNKTELVDAMAKETNLTKKDVESVLNSFINVVSGEEIKIAAATTPAFKAGKALKDIVNK